MSLCYFTTFCLFKISDLEVLWCWYEESQSGAKTGACTTVAHAANCFIFNPTCAPVTWLDVASTWSPILSKVMMTDPPILDKLGMKVMQLLLSRVHIEAWNLGD